MRGLYRTSRQISIVTERRHSVGGRSATGAAAAPASTSHGKMSTRPGKIALLCSQGASLVRLLPKPSPISPVIRSCLSPTAYAATSKRKRTLALAASPHGFDTGARSTLAKTGVGDAMLRGRADASNCWATIESCMRTCTKPQPVGYD
jgi:hypothetical protein